MAGLDCIRLMTCSKHHRRRKGKRVFFLSSVSGLPGKKKVGGKNASYREVLGCDTVREGIEVGLKVQTENRAVTEIDMMMGIAELERTRMERVSASAFVKPLLQHQIATQPDANFP